MMVYTKKVAPGRAQTNIEIFDLFDLILRSGGA
jgi:hypothetical protein